MLLNVVDNIYWIQTYTGKRFDLLNPDVDMICLNDIARPLSKLCRYTGHSDRFYSVAEHSIHVSNILSSDLALYGLLHDAAEAYIGDIAKPFKDILNLLTGGQVSHIEHKIHRVILEHFGIDPDYNNDAVKTADMFMLVSEHNKLLKPKLHWPLDSEYIDLSIPLYCWDSDIACDNFIDMFTNMISR